MRLEDLYKGLDPKDYYIGKVTQVYRSCSIVQIENINIMTDRTKFNSSFLPNTINNYVIVDSTEGIFLGEVFENKASRKNIFEMSVIADEKSNDYHELSIDTISLMAKDSDRFRDISAGL